MGRLRLDLDLVHEAYLDWKLPLLSRLESVFREAEIVEIEGLLALVARTLHALSTRGFSRVDHWEVHPGGWLPLPEPAHERLEEPVGHLLNALKSNAWKRVGDARSFSVRLSGPPAIRGDLVVRRVHRERGHAISLELRGRVTDRDARAIQRALRDELAVAHIQRSVPSAK